MAVRWWVMPQRIDDPAIITNDEILWRRIIPNWLCQESDGTFRPAKVAFIDRLTHEVSVHRAAIMGDHGLALTGHQEDSLAAVVVGDVRAQGLAVVADPTPDDHSHALICPSPTDGKARKLAKGATWVVLRRPVREPEPG